MEWSRQKVNSQNLNNGQEYTTDSQVSIEQLNAMVNSGLYSQDIVDGLKAQPYSASATYKYPNIVTYNGSSYMAIYAVDGVYAEFNNIAPTNSTYWAILAQKGQDGIDGVKGDSGITNAGLSNTYGNSDTNGYTQKAVNGLVSNPNLVINSNFAINQRGLTRYTVQGYSTDRWELLKNGDAYFDVSTKTLSGGTTGTYSILQQKLELNPTDFSGQYLTLSLNKLLLKEKCYISIGYYRGNTFSDIKTIYTSQTDSNFAMLSETVKMPTNLAVSDVLVVRVYTQIGGEIQLDWVKLELGEVPTAFTPPNLAEELLKCQRYYQVQNYSTVALDAYQMYNPSVKFLTMRTMPTPVLRAISDTGNISQGINTVYDLTTHTEINIGRTIQYVTVNSGIINSAGMFTVNNIYLFQVAYDAEL